ASTPKAGKRPKPKAEIRRALRKEALHAAVAVAERLDAAAELVRHREPQVADRRLLLQLQVTMPLADATAHRHAPQRVAGAPVRVPHSAAVEDERVIEHRAVTIRQRLQLVEEAREERHMVRVHLDVLPDLLRIVAVV